MYEFTEDCMIHIPQIDEEHRKLFQIINDALSLVKTTEDISGIAQEPASSSEGLCEYTFRP